MPHSRMCIMSKDSCFFFSVKCKFQKKFNEIYMVLNIVTPQTVKHWYSVESIIQWEWCIYYIIILMMIWFDECKIVLDIFKSQSLLWTDYCLTNNLKEKKKRKSIIPISLEMGQRKLIFFHSKVMFHNYQWKHFFLSFKQKYMKSQISWVIGLKH